MGVFYIKLVITYSFGEARIKRLYYNPFYVTYRGKGSKEYTEVFKARKYWILLAWESIKIFILEVDNNTFFNIKSIFLECTTERK